MGYISSFGTSLRHSFACWGPISFFGRQTTIVGGTVIFGGDKACVQENMLAVIPWTERFAYMFKSRRGGHRLIRCVQV